MITIFISNYVFRFYLPEENNKNKLDVCEAIHKFIL